MKDYLSAARRKRFCAGYLRTLDPERAAEEAGVKDGWALLADEAVRQELAGMRTLCAGEVRREDALRRLTELAFGRANDAVALALSPEREGLDVQGLDLSAVSEFKVTEKGAVEIRFLDRVKALEALCALLERQDVQIVLAHADRYPAENIERLIREGVPLQLNAVCLTRLWSRGRYLRWIGQGAVRYLGSDLHMLGGGYRDWKTCRRLLGRKFG